MIKELGIWWKKNETIQMLSITNICSNTEESAEVWRRLSVI